ncbi:MAG TPA: alpha/beta hydrolase [Syntrophomonadaceae bacterium]|nr:alpha/beta hydrolase [Syntrophomonadaceae bacterium]
MEKLWIKNRRGQRLAAYLFRPPVESSYIMIISHGFRGAKENAGRIFIFAEQLNKLGITVLAFDFAGSGESEGRFEEMTLSRQAEDLHSVIDFIIAREGPKPILLLGRSFGGSTTLLTASQRSDISGCIFWSTPVHLVPTFSSMMYDAYTQLKNGHTIVIQDDGGEFTLQPGFAQDLEEISLTSCIKKISDLPVLIIHGMEDEVVDPDNARYMAAHLEDVTLYMVEEATHRFAGKIQEREQLTLQWLRLKFDLK